MSFKAKMESLEDELGKLKMEHLSCNVEHRRLERKLELKNDELDDLKRELWFSKDAEAKAMKRYKRALEYNIEVEAELAEMKTRFEEERGQLLRQLSHWKEKLEADTACKSDFNDVQCASKSRKPKEFAKPIVLYEGEIVGDVSGDAINHNDDSSNDASDHKQEQTNIQIYVRKDTDEIISMSVEPSLTIHDLKSKIQDKEGLPPCQQILIFEGNALEDWRTLAQCNIEKKPFLLLTIQFLA